MPTDPGPPGPMPTMQLPAQAAAEPPARRSRRWLRWAVPVLALLLGVGIGGAGSSTDPTTSPQYLTLQGELESAEDEAGELGDEVAAAEERIRQAAAAAQTQLEQQTAEITARSAALDAREQDITARENAPRATGETTSGSSGSSSGSSSASGSSGAGSAPVAEPEPEPEVSVSASYGNCSEARAAGAAPVRVGDPGYGRHLDRDGDGVGCE